MKDEGVVEKVTTVLSEILELKPERIVPTARLREDLNASSLDQVDIIAEFENDFGIAITDDEIAACTTVDKLTELLRAKVQEKESSS